MIDKKFKNKTGVYKITIASHTYVGSSISLYKRLNAHLRALKKDVHENQYLQRLYNKYLTNFKIEVINVYENITYNELLNHEKYYIDFYNADINFKKDPTTQQNCTSTSKIVYQFDLFGNFIKMWKSVSEADRFYNLSSGTINKCISGERVSAKGFLWDYNEEYSKKIIKLYVFDKNGKFINFFPSTSKIYEKLYSEYSRKTVMSQLKKSIDSKYYKDYYTSTLKEPDLSKFIKIKNKYKSDGRCVKIKVVDSNNNEFVFKSLKEAVMHTFKDLKNYKNVHKHLIRNTPYKGFYFYRVL